jgi:activating signal cointegrator complex subunit 1
VLFVLKPSLLNRPADLSKANTSVINELCELVPMYEELASTAKVHLLQSVVSTVLVDTVFSSYFVGLSPSHTSHLRQMETSLASIGASSSRFSCSLLNRGAELTFGTIVSDEVVNQWRAMTLTMVKKTTSQALLEGAAALTEDVVSTVNRILGSITDIATTEARDQALRALVSNAIDLSQLLAVQKAVFEVSMPRILPHQRTMFDTSEMEDIGGEDEESLIGRDICCVTFPCMIKSGDERGSHQQFRNIIAKARVLCSPE